MLDSLTFRAKMFVLIFSALVMALLLSLTGYVGFSKLEKTLLNQTESASLLRNITMADMMHDAIKADVLSALVATEKPQIDLYEKDEIAHSVQNHEKIFIEQLNYLEKLEVNQTERVQFEQVKQDVNLYLNLGIKLIDLSFQDRGAAILSHDKFVKQFQKLEISLDAIGDIIEDQLKATELEAKLNQKIVYQSLLAFTLFGVVILIAIAHTVTGSLLRDLGGEPSLIKAIAKRISQGDISDNLVVRKGDNHSILYAMSEIKLALTHMISDVEVVTETVAAGDLVTRVNSEKYSGAFEHMLLGINQTLDSLVNPLNLTAEYLENIAHGEIPPKLLGITEDVNTINTIFINLNTTIDSLNAFIAEMEHMSNEHNQGDIDIRMDTRKFQGSYKTMAQGVNDMVAGHIAVKMKSMAVIKAFGEGNFDVKLETFPGKKAFINETIEQVRNNIKRFNAEMHDMSHLHELGDIDTRIDTSHFQGEYKSMAEGLNDMVAGHIAVKMKAMAVVKAFGEGNFDKPLDLFPGKKVFINETIEQVRRNIKTFIAEMKHMSDEHDKGDIDVRIDVNKFNGAYKEMAIGVNEMVEGHLEVKKKAMACIHEFGVSNFDAPLEQFPGKKSFINDYVEQLRFNLKALEADADMLAQAAKQGRIQERADLSKHLGGYRKIIEGFNSTLDTILDPIVTVKSAVESISTATKEISAGNSDLSHRTEQQAASLEQTASSMEQLASTVKQNADNAKQANLMVLSASDVAIKGGSMVHQVVETMASINESSRKIVDIISVIDGIALQTNILALNAAVEAARAGEQGRGFAVVASEVRTLAQRSAAAAKEIKALIGDSVEKVEDGSKLVNEAGQTMTEIVNSIQRVTDIMGNIAAASEEQSIGIDQVKRAVSQMDEATQQNAALVEQAAAAAESLEEQTVKMANTVAQFQFNADYRPKTSLRPNNIVSIAPKPERKSETNILKNAQDIEWMEF